MTNVQKTFFDPQKHIKNLTSKDYYKNLVLLRNELAIACDDYFQKLQALKVDLYLISQAVTSPIGLGSDSKPVSFNPGAKKHFLADSSQFGMEPLLLNSFDIVYCYLPSFRGEEPDEKHLNQFFHCEAELTGDYQKAILIAEKFVKHLTKSLLKGFKKNKFSFNKNPSYKTLQLILEDKFPIISFNEAIKLLEAKGYKKFIKYEKFGRILNSKAEELITKLVGNNKLPVWVTRYDRDTVAFYQKPDPKDSSKVLNADLLVPPLVKNGLSGEILGLGQRQDSADEILESMKRQKIRNKGQYDWYIHLRESINYQTTSGFGMGIERYVAWILGLESVVDACIYPVLMGVKLAY